MSRSIEMTGNPIAILKFQHLPTSDNLRRILVRSDRLRLTCEVNQSIEVTIIELQSVCQILSFVNEKQGPFKS